MYSLSSCWNSARHDDGRAMLREIRDLGFEYAELSHGTRISLLPGILDAVAAGEIKVSTLHNFCPLPMGVTRASPNIYQFSSANQRERELALRYTLKTFEFAERVQAPLVVLHLGSIEMKDYTEKLLELVERGENGKAKYQMLCAEAAEKRDARKADFIARSNEILKLIAPEAEKRGLKLGIENREALEEIPIDVEFEELFREINSPSLYYWHDAGHAQIKENLGFISHVLHLRALSPRLAGFHIHDVEFPGRDHRQPGTGSVDFAALRDCVKPEHIKVLELSPSLKPEQVTQGFAFIKSVWGPE